MRFLRLNQLVALIAFTCLTTVWGNSEILRGAEVNAFAQSDASTHYRAVFAQFLVVQPDAGIDSAISVSNVCASPEEVDFLLGGRGAPTSGPVTFVLFRNDGQTITYRTDSGPVGTGLNPDGTLSEGHTWTVRLAEVVSAALAIPESAVQFTGYGWVLSGFDCVAGTYNNTIFGVGFTQAYELLPAMGQNGFFGGMPIPVP